MVENREVDEVKGDVSRLETKSSYIVQQLQHQDRLILELRDRMQSLENKDQKACMTISGLPRRKNEDCVQLITKFLSQVMEIKNPPKVIKAFRTGGADTSPVKFFLTTGAQKGVIYGHLKNLKGKTKAGGGFFTVRDVMPSEQHE